jgi:hypothetical protein
MMFRFRGGAGFLSVCCGEWVYLQSEGEERNEYMFTSLAGAIWDQRQMSFVLLQGLCDFFELQIHTNVYLWLNTSVHSLLEQ